jgi:hypothetical protein
MSKTPVTIEAETPPVQVEAVHPHVEAEAIATPIVDTTPPVKAKSPLVPALLAGAVAGAVVAFGTVFFMHKNMQTGLMGTSQVAGKDANRAVALLEARLNALETMPTPVTKEAAVQQPSALNNTSTPTQDLTGIEKRLGLLESAPKAEPLPLEGLKAEINALKNKPLDFSPLTTRLSALEAKPAVTNEMASLKYVAQMGLLSSLEAGRPFTTELGALTRLDPTNSLLKSLEPMAKTGVKTAKDLLEQTPSLYALFEKNAKINEDASLTDKAKAALSSLVRVRPLNEQEGQSPSAILSRLETRLKSNDLLAAFGEWASLDAPLKKLTASFGAELQAASEAKAAGSKLMTELLKYFDSLK